MNEDQLYNMSDEDLEKLITDTRAATEAEGFNTEEQTSSELGNEDGLENLDNSQASDMTSEKETSETTNGDESTTDETAGENEAGTVDEGEEQTEQLAEKEETETQPVDKLKYRANGKEYEFTPDEIMKQFPKVFGQAMDYTRKMQAIKPWRQTIDAIEEAKLNHGDVSLMIDVLKGDKTAVAEILKRTGLDALDLDSGGESYVPKSYGRDESTLAIKDVVDEISKDQEYNTTQRILSNEWDEGSWSEMTKNPELIKLLHMDVKSGTYNKVQPIAEKLKLFSDGAKSDLEYYKLGAQEYFRELADVGARKQVLADKAAEQVARVEKVKQEEATRKATVSNSAARKAAAPTKPGPSKPQGVTDYLEDTDASFDEWYKNLKDSM
jgi:hypothetical protein